MSMNTRLKKVEEQSSQLLERLSSLESLLKDYQTVPDLIAILRNNTEMLNNVLNNPHTRQIHNSHDEEEKQQSEVPMSKNTHTNTQSDADTPANKHTNHFRRVI
jgi:hypothetical protein